MRTLRVWLKHLEPTVCPIPLPHPALPQRRWEGEASASPGYARNAAAAGPGRGKGQSAACCPEGGWKGTHAARLGRGPPLLSSLPHFPGPPLPGQHRGQVTQTLSRGSLSSIAEAGYLLLSRTGKCTDRGQLLCASSSSHDHSHKPRQLFKEMSAQTPELTDSEQLSEPGRLQWASNQRGLVGRGVRTRSLTGMPGHIISAPLSQAPGLRPHVHFPL